MAKDRRSRLVIDALDMTVTTRKRADVVHHPDRRSQCASAAFGVRSYEAGLRHAIGTVGDAHGNAMAEAGQLQFHPMKSSVLPGSDLWRQDHRHQHHAHHQHYRRQR